MPYSSLSHISHTSELFLVRKSDSLSPHVSLAKTSQSVIPVLTVTIPSGEQVNFHNVRVKKQSGNYEWEEIYFTFHKIEVTRNNGNKTAVDDWLNG